MAQVHLARAASEDLERLIAVLTLPEDTRQRVRRALHPLETLPLLGPELTARWAGLRFLLGPWRWMILVYHYDDQTDRVTVVTIQDARSSESPTASRP
jgi:plasmid stabilization system protein ParE